MRICVEHGCTEHELFLHPEREYSDVTFVYRVEECSDCGAPARKGFYYTGPEPTYTLFFVCEPCA